MLAKDWHKVIDLGEWWYEETERPLTTVAPTLFAVISAPRKYEK